MATSNFLTRGEVGLTHVYNDADFSKTNNTLSTVTNWGVTRIRPGTYHIKILALVKVSSVIPGAQLQPVFSGSMSVTTSKVNWTLGASNTLIRNEMANTALVPVSQSGATVNGTSCIDYDAVITVATQGNLSVQFAQAITDTSPATLLKSSSIMVTKVG